MLKKRWIASTYTDGIGVAFATEERLIWRACSRTLDFASTMDELAIVEVERQRTRKVVGFFWLAGTRIRAERAIVGAVSLNDY